MKKNIFLLIVLLIGFGAIVQAQDYAAPSRFEVGARAGIRSYDDDVFDDGGTWGLQARYYLQPSFRIYAFFDFFSSDESVFDTNTADFSASSDSEISTWMIGADFLSVTEPLNYFVGAGIGLADVDADFQTRDPNFDISGEFDKAFVFQIDGGLRYLFRENLTGELELSYMWGTADVDVSTAFQGVFQGTEGDEIDLDNFGAFLSLNYRFG